MLNKALLMGHLGQAPELKRTQGGQRYAVLSLATSDNWRDKNTGERRQSTEWHRVVVWSDGLLEVVEKFLKKGSKVFIEGAIMTRKWTDNEGVQRFTTEIVLQAFKGRITLLDRKQGVRDADGEDSYGAEPGGVEDYESELV